ncbi:unnamed protein product, partial [Rodentolepis nana]|uniref:Fibronectin type-III domain-containing protein n=1 Tax=Rodentolepis nana TaxID=102285 RepID=A0A0R3TMA3_RODNA
SIPPPHKATNYRPRNFKIRRVGKNRANLTWKEVTSPSAEVIGYLVYFQEDLLSWKCFAIRKPYFFLPFTKTILKGTIATMYAPHIDKTTVYSGDRSELLAIEKSNRTKAPPPQNVKLQQVGDNLALLSWDEVTSPGEQVIAYMVLYKEGNKKWNKHRATVREFDLLLGDEMLVAQVAAIHKWFNAKAPPPQNVELQQVGDNLARISWDEVTATGVTVLGYLVSYKDGNSKWKDRMSSAGEYDLPFENETFVAQVAAFHTSSYGQWSNILGEKSNLIGIQKAHLRMFINLILRT